MAGLVHHFPVLQELNLGDVHHKLWYHPSHFPILHGSL